MSSVAKQDKSSDGSLWRAMFQTGLYKPTQGRIVRQLTAAAVALLLILLAYEISNAGWVVSLFRQGMTGGHYLLFVVLAAIGVWIAYRLVNYSKAADFLISVEAEMNKVSWPVKSQIWRASLVVIFVILALMAVLWVFDVVWTGVFQLLGVRSR